MRVFFIKKIKIINLIILAVILLTVTSTVAIGVYTLKSVEAKEGIRLPIIMYHSVLNDKKQIGKYVISPMSLEEDFKYLKEKGYETVFVSQVIEYVYNGSELPDKPIIITFDDGYLNNYTYAYELLKKYNMKATISIVGAFSERYSLYPDANANYANLTWDDIKTLSDSGYIEIANHTYNMHSIGQRRGCSIKKGEKTEDYQKILKKDLNITQDLLEKNAGIKPNVFTYPFGSICNESVDVIKDLGFLATLSCTERINYITKDTECLYELGRYNRDGSVSTEKFMSVLEK